MGNSFGALVELLIKLFVFSSPLPLKTLLAKKRFHISSEEDTIIWLAAYMYSIL